MTRGGIRAVVAWTFVVSSACAARPRTEVIVTVDAEPGVRAEADHLAITVRGGAHDATALVDHYFHTYTIADGPLPLPIDVAVIPTGADATRIFEVEASALDVVSGVVAQARLRGTFDPGHTRLVRLLLEDRCRGIVCRQGETCRAGHCGSAVVDVTMAPELIGNQLPSHDAAADAAPDGGGDAGHCMVDHDCDDGVTCDGRETCIGGTCRAGVRVSCDDGIACTRDACSEAGCTNVPDTTLCTAATGGRCDLALGGCQYATCDATTCAPTPGTCETATCAGAVCMRASSCSAGSVCCAGACLAGGCEDGNPCTSDLCDPTAGCRHVAAAGACSDGDPCTVGDTCTGTTCAGTPMICDEGNPCTSDACDTGSGACTHVPVSGAVTCEDRDLCTVSDHCSAGTCTGSPKCDDGVACTVDSCASGTGFCSNVPNDAMCTTAAGGHCDPASGCQYPTCSPATCVPTPGACETASCSGATCSRIFTCTGGVPCCAGTCTTCDDGNPCTDDSCGVSGCVHANNTATCNDGDACTAFDTCSGGTCTGMRALCSDGNPCTTDSCSSGTCSHTPLSFGTPCTSGNPCFVSETCQAGSYCGGSPLNCNDSNQCTADSCDPSTGCVNTPLPGGSPCDDGNACTDNDMCVFDFCSPGVCNPGTCPALC